MKIHLHAKYDLQKQFPLNKGAVKNLLKALLQFLGSLHKEVSLYFVSVSRICELHEQFFQDPSPTDCISFPLNGDHLGEIFVCPKVAIEYAAKRRLDPYQELTLYVVHGVLHCLGFDDLEPSQRRLMRKKEKVCMEFLKEKELFLKP